MSRDPHADAPILVASDKSGDAQLVQKLLEPEFDAVQTSTDPDKHVEDFDRRPADVIVLAFDELAKAEHHYLGLYRQSRSIHLQPHRTVILCSKDEVRQAYALCRRELFDDYILFWPMNHDSPRLPMSVHLALRELGALRDSGPSAVEFANQARQLATLEATVQRQLARADDRTRSVGQAARRTEEQLGAALDGFSQRLVHGGLSDAVEVKNAGQLEHALQRLRQEELQRPLQALAQSVEPIAQWTREFKADLAPHLASSNALAELAEKVRPLVLVVDDDDTQRKLMSAILKTENYRLAFATNGLDALSLLRKLRPDVVLMDMVMPGMDGLETTRRIRAMPHLAQLPVIMITGKSEGNVVIDSLKAGAGDFVVKPVERNALLAKTARALRGRAPTAG